jgi:hypothetical protein
MVLQTKSPKGIIAVGIFLFFGAMMASLAGTTLVWPGTTLDRLWTLNPRAYKELAPHEKQRESHSYSSVSLLPLLAWVGSSAAFGGGDWQ